MKSSRAESIEVGVPFQVRGVPVAGLDGDGSKEQHGPVGVSCFLSAILPLAMAYTQAKSYHWPAFQPRQFVNSATSATASATCPAFSSRGGSCGPSEPLLRLGAEFDGPVPVLHRLGVLLQPVVGHGPARVTVPEELPGGDVARVLPVDRRQGADGLVEPGQTVGRLAFVPDQVPKLQ